MAGDDNGLCIVDKPTCRMLIADDEADLRLLLSIVLSDLGWDVQEAADGNEALERLEAEDFDLVLLDYRMPGLTGAEVYRQLCASGKVVPAILLTAASQAEELAALNGIPRFLGKPFGVEDLLAVIRAIASHCMDGYQA